ncbi:MAG: hypothetical protein MZV65_36210 [Chromatiales bacterium]|nr:hypothetical protein [Chromatiales bacterium]
MATFLKVIVAVVDTFDALDLVIQAALGDVGLDPQRRQMGAGGSPEIVRCRRVLGPATAP